MSDAATYGPALVRLDRDRCCGFGLCAQFCPEVFALDALRQAVVVDPRPQARDVIERAHAAAASCPQRIITVLASPAGSTIEHR